VTSYSPDSLDVFHFNRLELAVIGSSKVFWYEDVHLLEVSSVNDDCQP
jgi:hypothetical protein